MVLKRLVPFDQRKFESASLDIVDRLQNSYNAATGCLFHGTMKKFIFYITVITSCHLVCIFSYCLPGNAAGITASNDVLNNILSECYQTFWPRLYMICICYVIKLVMHFMALFVQYVNDK